MLRTAGRFTKAVAVAGFCFSSAMAAGLPGEEYVTQKWRDLFDGHSPTINPAYMTEENYLSVRGALCPTLAGQFFLYEAGIVLPVGLYQSFGATVVGLTSRDEIAYTSYDASADTISVDPSRKFRDVRNRYLLSYAINPIDRLSIGANLHIFSQAMDVKKDSSLVGLSVDLGLTYRFRHPLLGDHIIGLAGQNVFSPAFKGGKEDGGVMSQAINVKASWLARLLERRLEIGADINIKDFAAQATDFALSNAVGDALGTGEKKIEFEYNARLGGWIFHAINLYGLVGSGYLGGAILLNVPIMNNGRDFQAGYQFISPREGTDNSLNSFYFRGDFGKHREEIYARNMARSASMGPGNLYNKAMQLYNDGKYWDALFIFGKIATEHPDFFKNDFVHLYIGLCEENLDMREASQSALTETKTTFNRSVVAPLADLALMRVAYRNANSSTVNNQLSSILSSGAPDSIKYHAYYIAGENYLRDDNWTKAVQYFSIIPVGHPDYLFAHHSLGVAFAMSGDINKAKEALDNTIQNAPPSPTKSQKEIINRSYVLLGFIYYQNAGIEEKALSKAVASLRMVPTESYYYEDALLGIAWTALKASQWTDCQNAAKELATRSKFISVQSEGDLLQSFCMQMDKKYVEAYAILENASAKLAKYSGPSVGEKEIRATEYKAERTDYESLGKRANELALTTQASYVISQIDSLKVPQVATQQKIKDYLSFADEQQREGFFARNLEQVKSDVDYALAKVSKLSGQKASEKKIEKAVKQQEQIDDEMKKLEEQLKQLEGGTK